MSLFQPRRSLVAVGVVLGTLLLAACGDDDDETKATTMSVTTADSGKRFTMTAPKSVEGGLVTLNFRNDSKTPHEAQLIRVDGHTVDEVLDIVDRDKVVLPDWFKAEGGVGTTPPGGSGTATVKLPAGEYAIIDTGDGEGPAPSARGARATFKVTGDGDGEIEDTSAKVEVKDKGHHEFEFVESGLKAGTNNLTFDNKSKEIHHVIAFPIRGNATLAQVKEALTSDGPPEGPPPVDFEKGSNTAVLDGKRKETTRFKLAKGRSVLVCFLMDRNGKGKSHVQEGMLKEIDVQ